MTLKEAINTIEKNVLCHETIMTDRCCHSCLKCEYFEHENIIEAHKVILSFFLDKGGENNDYKTM